jgi:hypothetical protein
MSARRTFGFAGNCLLISLVGAGAAEQPRGCFRVAEKGA